MYVDKCFSYFGPGFGTLLLFAIMVTANAVVYIKIEAYQTPINGNDLLIEVKWTERIIFLINNIFGVSTILSCYLLYAYDNMVLMSFCGCFLYIYVGIIIPSVAIIKNPLMRSYIRARFPEPVIIVVD